MKQSQLAALDEILKDFSLPKLKAPKQGREAILKAVEENLKVHIWTYKDKRCLVNKCELKSQDNWGIDVCYLDMDKQSYDYASLEEWMEKAVIYE